jgi:hypothetical protein
MVPDVNDWTQEKLKWNDPRLYRLKELQSLMKAFDLGTDLLEDFQKRRFLQKRKMVDYEPIFEDIKKYALNDEFEKNKYEREIERMKNSKEWLVQIFMRFSEEMRSLLKFNSGWLETGSIIARYSIHKTQKLLDKIDLAELNEIERFLCLLIDPKQNTFTKSELIRNYDFPDVDLEAIDTDNY